MTTDSTAAAGDRRVLGYFVLTYAISWTLWVGGAALGTDAATWPVLSTLAGFGPLVAGGVLSWREGRLRGWARQAWRWRVDARWWAVALLGAPALSLVGYGLYVAATGVSLGLADGPLPIVYLTLFAYILLLRGGFGEELGWRGYALPHLAQRYTTTVAALLVGVAWAGWHLPLFFVQGTSQSGPFALYLVGVVGLSVVLAWLYVRAAGSVLLAAVFHAQWNVFDSGALFSLSGEGSLLAPTASAAVVWAVAIALVVADPGTMRSSQPRIGPLDRGGPTDD